MNLNLIEEHLSFGGKQRVYEHHSEVTKCNMRFGIYLPPIAEKKPVPVLYFLSGLTCTEQNFITKASSQRIASELGIAVIAPDTSPRGPEIADVEGENDLGMGAGFYVDATQKPWSKHYLMYSYVQKELPMLVATQFPVNHSLCGIFGHSMGGHGALILALKNPEQFQSVSAFAPICAPTQVPWGQKAFKNYLGDDKDVWLAHDACALMLKKGWPNGEILIDQGTSDPFMKTQLKPELFQQACKQANVNLNLRLQPGYDHSYFFIASFIEDHMRFHEKVLRQS